MNVLDIETYGGDVKPYCIVIRYRGSYYNSIGDLCIVRMLKWIFGNCNNSDVFYAHNLTFDGMIILNFLDICGLSINEFGTSIKRGSIYSLCITNGRTRIFLKCSAKFLPLSLKKIAEVFSLPSKISFDHSLFDVKMLDNPDLRVEILKYCKRDVEITYKFLKYFDSSVGLFLAHWSDTTYTISGISIKIFKNLFNNFYINLNLSSYEDALIRPSYYGGRCEVFGNPYQNENIYHYDFSGMYSNRLREKYPIGDGLFSDCLVSIEKPGFYYIEIESQDMLIPILPYRNKENGKLLFPNGKFCGLYWYEEILLFIENGGIIRKIHWGFLFEKEDYPFKLFAEKCIEMRKINKINRVVWKLIPNSFVGRLGLRNDNERTIIVEDSKYDPRNYDVISDRLICNKWIVRVKDSTSIKSNTSGNVIYASITTSKARILWWRTANNIIKSGGRLLYCDTDSIFIATKEDVCRTNFGNISWDWEADDTILEKACFISSKFYCIKIKGKTLLKIKGVPKNTLSSMSFEDIEKDFYSESVDLKIKFDFFNKKFLNLKIEEIEKFISYTNYDKRIFTDKKKKTKPLKI